MPLNRQKSKGKFGDAYIEKKPKGHESKEGGSKVKMKKAIKMTGKSFFSYQRDPRTMNAVFTLRIKPESILSFMSGNSTTPPLVQWANDLTEKEAISQLDFLGRFFSSWSKVIKKEEEEEE